MEINFTCLHCGNAVAVDESAVGMEVDCPHCAEPLVVPQPDVPSDDQEAADYGSYAADASNLAPLLEDEQLEVIDSRTSPDGATVEIVQYPQLSGASNVAAARNLYYAERSGMRLKMVRIRLKNQHVRVEPGALYFMKGHLQMKASTGGGVFKAVSRKLSNERFFVSEIHGVGEIYLEPTFGHFLLRDVTEQDEAIVVDKGLFYAGTGGLDISAQGQKNISSAMFGGEGYFQTRIHGQGVAVLYSPVPASEVKEVELRGDKLWVDGNFALARTEGIQFRVEKSSKNWIATSVSGEGLLQSFEGVGRVWIAPTQGIYQRLSTAGGLSALSRLLDASNTETDSE